MRKCYLSRANVHQGVPFETQGDTFGRCHEQGFRIKYNKFLLSQFGPLNPLTHVQW